MRADSKRGGGASWRLARSGHGDGHGVQIGCPSCLSSPLLVSPRTRCHPVLAGGSFSRSSPGHLYYEATLETE